MLEKTSTNPDFRGVNPSFEPENVLPDDPKASFLPRRVLPDDPKASFLPPRVLPDDPKASFLPRSVLPDDPKASFLPRSVLPDDPKACFLPRSVLPDDPGPFPSSFSSLYIYNIMFARARGITPTGRRRCFSQVRLRNHQRPSADQPSRRHCPSRWLYKCCSGHLQQISIPCRDLHRPNH